MQDLFYSALPSPPTVILFLPYLAIFPSYLLILTSGKTHGTEDPPTFHLYNIHISLHSSALRSPIPSLQPQSYLDKWSPSSLLTPLLEFTSSTSTFNTRLFSTMFISLSFQIDCVLYSPKQTISLK